MGLPSNLFSLTTWWQSNERMDSSSSWGLMTWWHVIEWTGTGIFGPLGRRALFSQVSCSIRHCLCRHAMGWARNRQKRLNVPSSVPLTAKVLSLPCHCVGWHPNCSILNMSKAIILLRSFPAIFSGAVEHEIVYSVFTSCCLYFYFLCPSDLVLLGSEHLEAGIDHLHQHPGDARWCKMREMRVKSMQDEDAMLLKTK